jgi:hypothetical protein
MPVITTGSQCDGRFAKRMGLVSNEQKVQFSGPESNESIAACQHESEKFLQWRSGRIEPTG